MSQADDDAAREGEFLAEAVLQGYATDGEAIRYLTCGDPREREEFRREIARRFTASKAKER